MREIIQHLPFGVWVTSLKNDYFQLHPFTWKFLCFCFLTTKQDFVVQMFNIFIIHSLTGAHTHKNKQISKCNLNIFKIKEGVTALIMADVVISYVVQPQCVMHTSNQQSIKTCYIWPIMRCRGQSKEQHKQSVLVTVRNSPKVMSVVNPRWWQFFDTVWTLSAISGPASEHISQLIKWTIKSIV